MLDESSQKSPPKSPRVADFSTHLSGPVASRQLMQLGADIIKVENPKWGDGNRDFPPYFHDEGIHHLYLNAGTRSLALDARSELWPRAVEAIARWADVVIVGNRPKNAERLGIDYAKLRAYNPKLIYCMITGYGLEGEWASYPAHGLNMDALAGTVPLERNGDRPDVPGHYRSVGTTLAGIEAALGIMVALHRRDRGEGGQLVQVSVWESAMSWLWRDLTTQANVGRAWTAYRDLGSRYCIYGASDDKALLVCPIERRFWESFCDVLELPAELRVRGQWQGGTDMGADYVALGERDLIQARIAARPRDEWVRLLARADVPVAPVLDWREAMQSPHAQANGLMTQYEYRGHTVRLPTTPVSVTPAADLADTSVERLAKAHRDKREAVTRAPHLGEHNKEVLKELGIET